jgi:hypothetical protein
MVGHDLPVGNILSNKIQNPSSIGDRGSKGRRVALKLGEMMVESGLIDKEQLLLALKSQRANGGKLGENLVRVGALLDEEEIASFVAKQMNLGKIALTDIDLEEDTVKLIPEDLAIKYTVIAVSRTNKVLTVATSDPKMSTCWTPSSSSRDAPSSRWWLRKARSRPAWKSSTRAPTKRRCRTSWGPWARTWRSSRRIMTTPKPPTPLQRSTMRLW